jgi:hypothetical protein
MPSLIFQAMANDPPQGEQRYIFLECKVGVFEDLVRQHDQFAHDGGEG